jgi:hypothetical protein
LQKKTEELSVLFSHYRPIRPKKKSPRKSKGAARAPAAQRLLRLRSHHPSKGRRLGANGKEGG